MELKAGYKKTELGVIPEDWIPTLLDSIAQRGSGHTPSKSYPEYWNGDIKWVSLQDSHLLDNGIIYDSVVNISEKGLANSSAKLHPIGTVILSRDAGVGKSAILGSSMAVSQHFIAWFAGRKLNNTFLYYWLQFQKREFERIAFGNTIKTIGLPYFKALKVPLPTTKAEQEAIAEALSDADELIASLEKLISKKRLIKQGAMQELLTGKRRLPGFSEDWIIRRLGDHVRFLKTGAFSRSQLIETGSVRYLHYGDIHTASGLFLAPAISPMPFLPDSLSANLDRLQDGDLVFADASEDREGVGKSIELTEVGDLEVVSGLHTIAARFDKTILADGFKTYLQFCPSFQKQLRRLAAGTKVYATTRTHIGSIELNLPNIDEQAAIASLLSDMDKEIQALEFKLSKARLLKQGMMQELLTGRIRLV